MYLTILNTLTCNKVQEKKYINTIEQFPLYYKIAMLLTLQDIDTIDRSQ